MLTHRSRHPEAMPHYGWSWRVATRLHNPPASPTSPVSQASPASPVFQTLQAYLTELLNMVGTATLIAFVLLTVALFCGGLLFEVLAGVEWFNTGMYNPLVLGATFPALADAVSSVLTWLLFNKPWLLPIARTLLVDCLLDMHVGFVVAFLAWPAAYLVSLYSALLSRWDAQRAVREPRVPRQLSAEARRAARRVRITQAKEIALCLSAIVGSALLWPSHSATASHVILAICFGLGAWYLVEVLRTTRKERRRAGW